MERIATYRMFKAHLANMNYKVQQSLVGEKNWWVTASLMCQKFITQATSLEDLLLNAKYNLHHGTRFDISSIWTLIRSLYETHSVFYHLFCPCEIIEENILRFKLWQLDSIRSLIKFKSSRLNEETSDTLDKLLLDEKDCVRKITELGVFSRIPAKLGLSILQKSNWRYDLGSKRKLSYNELILNTGLAESHFENMYEYTSMHVHPGYIGIRQNNGLTIQEKEAMIFVALMQSCFVLSFFIRDLRSRFEPAKQYFDRMNLEHCNTVNSFIEKASVKKISP